MQGTLERLRLLEWLNFLSSEMRQGLRSFVRGSPTAEVDRARSRLEKHFAWIDLQLFAKPLLLGRNYSVDNIYLWVSPTGPRPRGATAFST
jgi:glutathione S-transferase